MNVVAKDDDDDDDQRSEYNEGGDEEDTRLNDETFEGTSSIECTSGQSEDYPSHWGVYIYIWCLY